MKTIYSILLAALPLLSNCGDKEKEPAPTPVTPVRTAMQHRVTMRYSIQSFGDASQLPATPPRITVDYETIQEFASGLQRATIKQEGAFSDATTNVKEVVLAPIVTYNNTLKPRITITIQVDQVPPTGLQRGYRVPAELFIDGVSVGGAVYSASFAAAQNPATPLVLKGVLEINH
jgi:hypothetical protein